MFTVVFVWVVMAAAWALYYDLARMKAGEKIGTLAYLAGLMFVGFAGVRFGTLADLSVPATTWYVWTAAVTGAFALYCVTAFMIHRRANKRGLYDPLTI